MINHAALCTRQGLTFSSTQKISMGYIEIFMMAITILLELSETTLHVYGNTTTTRAKRGVQGLGASQTYTQE